MQKLRLYTAKLYSLKELLTVSGTWWSLNDTIKQDQRCCQAKICQDSDCLLLTLTLATYIGNNLISY